MTKAQPLGHLILSDILGEKIEGPVDKKRLSQLLVKKAKENPQQFGQIIMKLKQFGDEVSTLEGITVALSDLDAVSTAPLERIFKKVKNEKDPEKRRKLITKAFDLAVEIAKKHPGNFGLMVRSGGRGNPVQLAKIVASPVGVTDDRGQIYPWMVKDNYAKGLKPEDYWVEAIQSHRNVVLSNISVSEPGEMSKLLNNVTTDKVITEEDCGTLNGIAVDLYDDRIYGRFLARPVGGYPRNTLLTQEVILRLKKKYPKGLKLIIRSPMTCEASDGICQKCYGLDFNGKLPPLGTNVGVKAAHALSEPLTQMSLNFKHGVRALTAGNRFVGGIKGVRQLLEIPQTFTNKAVLARETGKVTSIERAPQGGHYVYINDDPHYVPVGLKVIVKKGDRVEEGQPISEGVIKPDEYVRFRGLGEGRKYLADVLKNVYEDSGVGIDPKHFEVVAKSIMNYVVVQTPDPKNGLLPGDVLDVSRFGKIMRQRAEKLPIDKARGYYLADNVLHYTVGTKLLDSIIKDLKEHGIKEVFVVRNKPFAEPIVKPIQQVPFFNPNWLAKLSHRAIKRTLISAAKEGEKGTIKSTHPIPGYLYGQEFGKGGIQY